MFSFIHHYMIYISLYITISPTQHPYVFFIGFSMKNEPSSYWIFCLGGTSKSSIIIHFFHWDFPSTPPFLATSIMTSCRGAGSAPASKASRSRASSTCSTHCSNSAARSWSPWLARCLGTVGRSWDGLKGGDVYGDWTKICDFNGEWTLI